MSEIKVNKISPRAACGTVTLGDSGDTFTIPAGATINNQGTATNFGATGSASWTTTVKTSTFTAVAGEGYFVNTTGGAVTVNLPAGTPGAVVAIKDYANTFDTNPCTVAPNGSEKIGGDSTTDGTLKVEGIAVTIIYIDSTRGWLVTDSGLQSELPTTQFISATGGTESIDGNFKIHTFTGPGTFQVTCAGGPSGSSEVSYMVVAGGGSGGYSANGDGGGGGGAGGFREGKTPQCTYTSSPIACTSGSNNGLSVTATSYPITVGGGGTATGQGNPPGSGSPSTFAGSTTITSAGGGGGAQGNCGTYKAGVAGGSGGGGGNGGTAFGGNGNTPSVSPAQGFAGGDGLEVNHPPGNYFGGGGGGATAVGVDAANPGSGPGGAGATTSINGSATAFAGGGGGACVSPVRGGAKATGGAGGGGDASNPGTPGTNGTVNTGGGAGAGSGGNNGGNGGSGIVIIRYKFQ